tara:strand:- start:4842 stop:5060 length:219 start_codon:yes stop_codon:yes gene_type:complete
MKLTNEKWIAYTCEITERILQMKFGKNYKSKCLIEYDGGSRYTERVQEIFDNIYDDVEVLLRCNGFWNMEDK